MAIKKSDLYARMVPFDEIADPKNGSTTNHVRGLEIDNDPMRTH